MKKKESVRRALRLLPLILLLILTVGCVNDNEPEPRSLIEVGDPLPQFSVMLNDGSTLTTEMLRGTESMIVFFTTTCPDCRRELPRIQAYADAHSDLRVVCISRSQTARDVESFWQTENLTLPYSAQPDAAIYSLFATAGVPRVYCADPDLRVTAIYVETFPLERVP